VAELRFDDGLVTYNINDKVEVRFNPLDSNFVEKLYTTFEELDQKQDSYKADIEKIAGKKEIFEFARERDAEMRTVIDGLFGVPVCAALFGDMNVYAMSNGLPVWCNLMLAVMDEVDSTFTREEKATSPRVAKYTAKYSKYQKKYHK
jgi:hypothetical protein